MSYSLPLQKAIYDSLSAQSLRVFDSVPKNASFPYITFGPSDEVEADAECFEAATVTQQLDVWSRQPGFVEARNIASAIRDTLHRQDIVLDGAALVEIEVQNVRYFRDPDGITSHAAITIRSIIEQ